ncbi:hypothetical protein [Hydrogenophaga sp.]|uniref:hypothetical protein n=1 Tax=Hydrogenophaga sp. TaxID=1904254 RepID=UPI0027322924|nr:hypothetical protein [Hydrogenophaga sp.]MDP1684479.1 hypothetical protein [Hydrogenophaga sp.]
MNTNTTFKDIRKRAYRQVPGTVLLAALAACGGGGGSESTASRDTSSANMVRPADPGSSGSFIQVVLDPSNTPAPVPAPAPAPPPARPSDPGSAQAPAPSSITWIKASDENQTFSVSGTAAVRYGVGNTWIQRNLSGTVQCTNSFFGADPASGVRKTCEVSSDATVIPPSAPVAVAPFSCAAGAITCIAVTSTSSSNQVSVPVTFGQPFKSGDWQHATQSLVAKVDGINIPFQSDEISSHRDGSARFAVLSGQLTNMQPHQTRIVNLYTVNKTTSQPNVPSNPSWNLEVEAQVFDANGNASATLIAQPHAQLIAQIANSTGRRLSGAVTSEYTVVTDFKDKSSGIRHPHLSARFHIRLVDAGNRIRTDVVMENTRTWTDNPGNISYSMIIKSAGVPIHTQPRFTHYHHARWHKVVWTGSSIEPQSIVRHHMPYFLSTKITWNYDLNVKLDQATLQDTANDLAQADTSPMGAAMLNTYMPSTGGRGEIGVLPRWTALYLMSQDERAYRSMMAIADASASVPIHYRDEVTKLPLDVVTHPNVAVRFGTSSPKIPQSTDTTKWTPDTAHQGSYAYIPYIITGDNFYLDQMHYWTAWNIAGVNPEYREWSKGLIHENELRAQAWVMRSIAEATWATPDSHTMKAYFATRLVNNLAYYKTAFPNNASQSPLGMISWSNEQASVWQNDYFSMVLSLLAENNEPDAAFNLAWFTKFTVGRFLNESNGFCVARAPGGYWINRVNGIFVDNWRDLFNRNYPADAGKSCDTLAVTEGYPDWAGGYAASARALLGATANANITGAKDAYMRWKAMTPLIDASIASGEVTWAIAPR